MPDDAKTAAENAARYASRQFADRLAAMAKTGKASRSGSGLALPTLDADPDPDGPTTLWRLTDGRIRSRNPDGSVSQLSGSVTGSSSSAASTTPDPMPQRYQTDYPATWGVTYCPKHGLEAGNTLGYGATDDHGNRQVMLGFSSAIGTDLAGAVVRDVSLRFANASSDVETVTISIGVHNSVAAPSMFGGTRRYVSEEEWPSVGYGDEYHTLTAWIGRAFADGTIKGLTIDQPEGMQFAGTMRWDTALLRVAYTR